MIMMKSSVINHQLSKPSHDDAFHKGFDDHDEIINHQSSKPSHDDAFHNKGFGRDLSDDVDEVGDNHSDNICSILGMIVPTRAA